MSQYIPIDNNVAAQLARAEIGAASSYAIPFLASSKYSGCSQTVMMIATVAAVIGVAMSIFSQNIPAIIAFSSMGLISIMGVFIAESALEGEKLEGALNELKKQNFLLKEHTGRMTAAVKSINSENTRLQLSHDQLKGEAEGLEEDKSSLKRSIKSLESSLQRLSDSNKVLKENEEILEKRLSDLSKHVAGLSEVHTMLLETNLQFTQQVGLFHDIVVNLESSKDTVNQLIGQLSNCDGMDPYALKEMLALTKALVENILAALLEDREKQSELLDQYNQKFSSLQQRCGEVLLIKQYYEDHLHSLGQLSETIKKSSQVCDAQRREILLLIEQIHEKEALAQDRMQKMKEQELALIDKHQQLLNSLSAPLIKLSEALRHKEEEAAFLRRALQRHLKMHSLPQIVETDL
jgi:chromosome segregation ATPase